MLATYEHRRGWLDMGSVFRQPVTEDSTLFHPVHKLSWSKRMTHFPCEFFQLSNDSFSRFTYESTGRTLLLLPTIT